MYCSSHDKISVLVVHLLLRKIWGNQCDPPMSLWTRSPPPSTPGEEEGPKSLRVYLLTFACLATWDYLILGLYPRA